MMNEISTFASAFGMRGNKFPFLAIVLMQIDAANSFIIWY